MSNSTVPRHQVELCSLRLADNGQGFVMDFADDGNEAVRLECPTWMLYQLMRVLPQIDAALHQRNGAPSTALIAYPLLGWTVERSGLGDGVAMCLRNDRHVEAGFHLDLADAQAFHRELGAAIERAAVATN